MSQPLLNPRRQRSAAGLYPVQDTAMAFLCELFPESRNKLLVLHVGMGTGRLAEEMLNRGFYLNDVADTSSQAVNEARRRNLYDKIYKCGFSTNQLPVPDGIYDIVISTEAFYSRQMPCEVLGELVRICKPGGVVVIAVQETLCTDDGYTDRLRFTMMDLQTDGFWELLIREIVPDFSDGVDNTTIVYVFKISWRH